MEYEIIDIDDMGFDEIKEELGKLQDWKVVTYISNVVTDQDHRGEYFSFKKNGILLEKIREKK